MYSIIVSTVSISIFVESKFSCISHTAQHMQRYVQHGNHIIYNGNYIIYNGNNIIYLIYIETYRVEFIFICAHLLLCK